MQNDKTPDFRFSIIDVQTVTFPLPSVYLTRDKNRLFFVSVTDGKIIKDTGLVLLNRKSLHWSETLDGFIVESSSQVTLKVFEKHDLRENNLIATFVIPYEVLRSSRNLSVPSVDNSKKKKAPPREISVTWSECHSNADTAEETRLRLQTIKDEAHKMITPGLAAQVATVSDGVGAVVDAADTGFDSMQDFLAKCKAVSDRLDFVMHAVDAIAEVHPYAKIAWSVISFIPKKISGQIQLDENVIDLLDAIILTLDLGHDTDELATRCKRSKNHEITFVHLLEQINECGHFIQSYVMNDSFWKRLIKNVLKDGKTIVDNYRQKLEKLRDDFLREVIVTVETNVFRILAEVTCLGQNIKEVDESIKKVDLDMKLRELLYGEGTEFDRNKRCLPQTRLSFLDAIIQWINDPDTSSPRVLALFGQAGTGKSSIAHEIAHRYSRINRLTTSYFFVRDNPSGREPYRFFTTLARDLCKICPAFKVALGKIIDEKPEIAHVRNYTMLIEALLRDPVKDLYFVGPIVIVIDALDENDDAAYKRLYAGGNSISFQTALLQCVSNLPSNFRILITSRPEKYLLDAIPESSSVRHMYMNDERLGKEIDNDIFIYTDTRLGGAGVSESDVKKLAKKAEGLFQWVSVACDYVLHPPRGLNSKLCIQRVLNPTTGNRGLNPLDILYTTVLERFDINDPDIHDNFQSAMGHILGSFAPLSVDSLNMMSRFDSSTDDFRDVSDIVKDLGSLLSHVTPTESTLPIAPLHTSFRDFLTDKTRSGNFYVNLDDVHVKFASATLRTMQAKLQFNICKLETSYHLNSEVKDLKQRIEDNIPHALSYSSRFWADHVARVFEFNSEVFEALRNFMKERFLFWLELLSVRGEVRIARPSLLSLQVWLAHINDRVENEEMDGLVKDAILFVRYFGYPIAQSAPHIYLSALPFCPSSSIISKVYTPRCSTLRVEMGKLTKWPALETTIYVPPTPGYEGWMRCVTFSKDGEYIAAGVDLDVHVWSTSTGIPASKPLRVKNGVGSVALSDDGQRLAIGLRDGMILIWDVMKGTTQEVWGPWIPVGVSAVALAEDGKQLVLGLHDCRVWVWDLEKAEVVGEAFFGHNNPVWAVSFLDREHILSRSGFRTVRVWEVKTREAVTRTDVPTGTIDSAVNHGNFFLRDHSCVKSGFVVCSWSHAIEGEERYWPEGTSIDWSPVATLSSDGKLVATCSHDRVHVWFAKGGMAGSLASGPFSNEEGACLAFSPDGQRIACGTRGAILRVWNVQLVDEDEIESSNRRIPWSVAFMPDWKQIVAGWNNGRVEVLNASMGHEVTRITEGVDTDNLDWPFVAVSPNGDCIASTRDDAMYIWTRTGKLVAGPLISGDNKRIWSVVFSQDSNAVAYATWEVCVLSASTGALIAGPKKFTSGVTSLALSPSFINGSMMMKIRVAVAVRDKMFIWDTLTGEVAGPFMHHADSHIRALVFSSDGKYITSVAQDYTLCIWDSFNGKALRGPVELHDPRKALDVYGRPSSPRIALALDGRKVAFMGINDMILFCDVLYQGYSDVVLHSSVLAGHVHSLNFFSLSRDGRYLATPSNDRTIKIWDLKTALELKQTAEKSASDDSHVFNLDETWIDDNGWATYADGDGGARRLIWVPDIHRNGLYRPSNTCVVGGEKETRLDLKDFVHGKNWVRCWLGPEHS